MNVAESKYPVLVLSFRNCEFHCCHLDGYKDNKEALMNRLSLIEAFFKQNSRYRIWYNVDDSVLTDEIIEQIIQSILRMEKGIVKIAFIGLGAKKGRFKRVLRKVLINPYFPIEYFSDAELAKEWLI